MDFLTFKLFLFLAEFKIALLTTNSLDMKLIIMVFSSFRGILFKNMRAHYFIILIFIFYLINEGKAKENFNLFHGNVSCFFFSLFNERLKKKAFDF